MSALDRIALVADPGTFVPWDIATATADRLSFIDTISYSERLRRARDQIAGTEAVCTGRAQIGGRGIAVIASEFGFIGGSIGLAAAERVVRAFDRAIAEQLPVVALVASAGMRMQEGPLGFYQMAAITDAVREARHAGLPYFVYLMHPTTGGVLASYASLGHVTWAEPGALIALTGSRASGATCSGDNAAVQMAEARVTQGKIDGVVAPDYLRAAILNLLRNLDVQRAPRIGPRDRLDRLTAALVQRTLHARRPRAPAIASSGWDAVVRTRAEGRPSALDLILRCTRDITWLHGDGEGGGDDPALLLAVARISDVSVVLVGQDRSATGRAPRATAIAMRKARRGMRLAAELRLPLVAVVDTAGPAAGPGHDAEDVAGEVARALLDMTVLPSATLGVLLGEGAGGAAIALSATDRVICAEDAWLAPIVPEQASAILFGDGDHAQAMADAQQIDGDHLLRLGIVDTVVREPRRLLRSDPASLIGPMSRAIARCLPELTRRGSEDLPVARTARLRRLMTLPEGTATEPDRTRAASAFPREPPAQHDGQGE
jgi:acetyl-CoA carboxylase carboxyl transferase subunit beta